MPNKPPKKQEKRFAVAVSGVIARLMRQQGYDSIFSLFRQIPEYAQISPMTVYSNLYAVGRPSVWILHHVAEVLGTSLDKITREAIGNMSLDKPLPTVEEVYKDNLPKGKNRAGRKASGKGYGR